MRYLCRTMKKIFAIVLMAAAMISTSCLEFSKTDAVYEISVGTTSYSVSGMPGGEAYQAADDMRAQVRAFSDRYCSQWVVTYSGGTSFAREESAAVEDYEVALREFEKIHDSFVAKYGSTKTADGTSLECTYKLYLKRNDPDKGDATVRQSEEFLFEVK